MRLGGIEPPTCGLKGRCSLAPRRLPLTTELQAHGCGAEIVDGCAGAVGCGCRRACVAAAQRGSALDRGVHLVEQLGAVGELEAVGEVAVGLLAGLAAESHVERDQPRAVKVLIAPACDLLWR